MKTNCLCALAISLAIAPIAYTQDRPARVAQRISVEKAGDDVAAVLTTEDLGTVKERGTATYSNGIYRIASSGADIWGRADSFHFTSMLLDGDAQLVARVASVDKTGPWAKAGIMLRDTNSPDARHALIAVTPERGFTFQFRNGAKARTVEAIPRPVHSARPVNSGSGWVKLVRQGNRVTGYSSLDSTNWIWEGTVVFTNLPAQLLAGLAVSSQDAARICHAVFESVSMAPAPEASPLVEPVVGQGDGLRGRYFQNLDFSGKSLERTDATVDFNWPKGEPAPGLKRDRFAARWEGEVQAQYTEPYAFHLVADDRARLWINGRLIIDDFVPHATAESAMRINLIAGEKYLVRVEYFQHGQAAEARLLWSSPSTPRQIIPQSQLYSALVDSDGDGLPDLWELDHGLNPKDPADATADPDDDGLRNLQEYVAGKNPLVADSYAIGLPEPWRGQDIGTPAVKGYASHHKGNIAVTSAGADIWGNLDSFHFVHQTLKGDGEILARVVSLQNVDPWAKASVMFRASLTDQSPHAMIAFTPERGISFQYRSVTAGQTTDEFGGDATPPRWLKLARRGHRFNGYRSNDGQAWEWVASEQIELPEEAFVGLAVSSHVPGQTTEAVFDSISIHPLASEDAPKPLVGSGDGLLGTYYDVITKSTVTRVDPTVDFDWGTGSPHTNIGKHFFSTRWQGMIEAQFSETYAFHVITDDGFRLWLDGKQVIDAWSDRAATKMTAKVALRAGHKYLVKMEYYERTGEAVAKLHWSSPSTPKQPIPQTQLYSPQHADYDKVEDKDRDGIPGAWERLYGLDDTDQNDANADPDKDSLANLQEYLAGTNPLHPDTDNDGIPDGWEVQHGLNPNDPNDASRDHDHDGLTSLHEYQAGTDPENKDTDGDGLTDAMEILETRTNPLANDIKEITTVVERKGAEAGNLLGQWLVKGDAIHAVDRRGGLEYNLKTAGADMYRIEIEGGSYLANDDKGFQLIVSVDGEPLGRCHLLSSDGGNGLAHIFTPWLAPGEHTVRVFWDNAAKNRSLRVDAVRLQSLRGGDENKNGVSDWVENRLRALCGVEMEGKSVPAGAIIQSRISPACLEGRGGYLSMMQLPKDVVPQHGPGDRWFANMPLSLEPRSIETSFQNGGLAQTNLISWQPTDLRESGDLVVRKGDALLFTMSSGSKDQGVVRIAVVGLTNFIGAAGAAFPCRFENPGQFVVTGSFVREGQAPESKTITVQVVAGNFDDRPAIWAAKSRLWVATNLPPQVVLQSDARLDVQELQSTNAGRLFGLAVDVEEPHWIVARAGEGGPILDHTAADGFRLYSSSETELRVVQTYEDGSQLIEMTLVSTPVLPQISIRVDLVVAGVIFEDGTISRVLTAADFNPLGEATVRFLRPESARTSVCHKTRVFQGPTFLGIHR
jgi:hypothetical protein